MKELISEYEEKNEQAHAELDEKIDRIGNDLTAVKDNTNKMQGNLEILAKLVTDKDENRAPQKST